METSPQIKVRLEHSRKSSLLIVVILSLSLFITSIIVAYTAGPEIAIVKSKTFAKCGTLNDMECVMSFNNQEFSVTILDINYYNQLLYLKLIPMNSVDIISNITLNFTLVGQDTKKFHKIKSKNKTYSLKCLDGDCDTYVLFYVPYIEYSSYELNLILVNTPDIEKVKLELTYINKSFTKFVIGVKYFFFSLCVVSLIIFFYTTWKIPFRLFDFESLSILIMNISLLIFNEPLIGAYKEFYGLSSSALSVFCNVQFIACLIMFWLLSLQHFKRFRCKILAIIIEFALISLLFALLFVAYMYANVNLKFNPTYDWKNDFNNKTYAVYSVIIAILVCFALWILLLSVWSLCGMEQDRRKKAFRGMNFVMMVITFVFIGVGYFQPTLFNLYFLTILWMFTPIYESYKELKFDKESIDFQEDNKA
jgi:hypothetical protein